MRRLLAYLAVLLFATSADRLANNPAFAQSPAELTETGRFVASFQNPDGGFASKRGGPSSLGSTSSAVRTLKYVGGSIPDVPKCVAYLKSCRDETSGGFAPTPGADPDVRTTAVGLMAFAELKILADTITEAAVRYLAENAKTFEEIRIAVAGLEAAGAKAPVFDDWSAKVRSDRNADGTWGEGRGAAYATGGAAVALLRMGVDLDKTDAILRAMRGGQQPDGGWSRDGGESTLEASYRIVRGFFMMKAKPDLAQLRAFVARCRRPDGGYATTPDGSDGSSDLGGTYYAAILLRWARQLDGEPAIVETAGFEPLFDGKTLDGWEGDTGLWSVRDGMIVGKSPGIKKNNFLATRASYGDFILKLSFRLVDGSGNSGIMFRSERIPDNHEMIGYQADMGENYWGCLYDESRRRKVLVQANEQALKALNKNDWNEYVIRAEGRHVRLSLNGVTSVDYREPDAGIPYDGRVALQIHSGGPMEVQFKDIYIQALPIPSADPDATTPGFHLRALKTGGGEREYVVSLPEGYDGSKAFPVILFLHGSGERGTDGITSSQIGLGAAIARRPEGFPFIGVFPQARETWAAGSDDSNAALAALDEVMATYKADLNRIVVTGLSMGGAGTWGLASTHPERFSAAVIVCGRGAPDDVAALKGLPLWFLVGDADRDQTVLNGRDLVMASRSAGNEARHTEYRGVPHNSWDRAYNDPEVIDWMLSKTRRDGR